MHKRLLHIRLIHVYLVFLLCLVNVNASEKPSEINVQANDTLTVEQYTENTNIEYIKTIRKADIAYRFKRYIRARNLYKEASLLKPTEKYPQQRLEQLENKFKPTSIWFFKDFNFDRPTTLITVLLWVILYSIATMLLLLVIILLNRTRMERMDKINQELREKYQASLLDYLYDEENTKKIVENIREVARSPYSRQFLINEMIDLSINLTGEPSEKLRQLYLDLNLKEVSLKKANSYKWHIKVKGFKELAFMNIKEANDIIVKALDSSNNILRMEAQIALVRLIEKEPYTFLDFLEKPFSLWEQMNIHELIIYHKLPIPDFEKWIRSTNKSVSMFAINMISVFKQTQSLSKIITFLSHSDADIRHNAIKTLGSLKSPESLPDLKIQFKAENETYENKLSILETIQKIPEEKNIDFLKWVLENEEDVFIQIAAAKGIRNIGESGKNELEKLSQSPDYRNYQIILRHVLDKRI